MIFYSPELDEIQLFRGMLWRDDFGGIGWAFSRDEFSTDAMEALADENIHWIYIGIL